MTTANGKHPMMEIVNEMNPLFSEWYLVFSGRIEVFRSYQMFNDAHRFDTKFTKPDNASYSFFSYMNTEASGTYDAVPAAVSYFTGVLMITIFVLGFVENATVLFVYAKVPKLRKANMSFVIGLALSDTGQTVFNIPFVAVACFYRKWIFGHLGCLYIGFVTTWFGLSQISLLCVIALERYFIIVHQSRKLSASEVRTVIIIVSCFVYGAGWATGPLVGWSEYKLVAGEISCSLSWTLKDDFHLSYVLSLFTFVWFLPLSIIAFAYTRIAILIYQEKGKRRSIRQKKKSSKERKVAVTVLLMVGAFVISWTPYSIVALMTAFGDMRDMSSGVYLVPAAFAKASIIWNPIIYIARHKEFRRAFRRTRNKLLTRLSTYTTDSGLSTKRRCDHSPDGSTKTKSIISSQGDFDRISTESKHCQVNLLNNGTSIQMHSMKERSPVRINLFKDRSPVEVNLLKDKSSVQVNLLKDRPSAQVNCDRSTLVAVHVETVPCSLDSRIEADIDKYLCRQSVVERLQKSYSCEDVCTNKVMLKEYSALRSTSFKRFKLR